MSHQASALADYAATEENCKSRGAKFVAGNSLGGISHPPYCEAGSGLANVKPDEGNKVGAYDVNQQIQSLLYYRSLGNCFVSSTIGMGNGGTILSPNSWWEGSNSESPVGPYLKGMSGMKDNFKMECKNNGTLNKNARDLWNIEYDNWLCAAGWLRIDTMNDSNVNNDPFKAGRACTNEAGGIGDVFAFYSKDPSTNSWGINSFTTNMQPNSPAYETLAVIKDRVYGGNEPEFTTPMLYHFYRQVLFNSCSSTNNWVTGGSTTAPGATLSTKFSVKIVSEDGKTDQEKWFNYKEGFNKDTSVTTRPGPAPAFSAVNKTCGEMVEYLSNQSTVDAYKANLATWVATTGTAVSTATGTACTDGTTTCEIEGSTTCAVQGIGWIICPVVNFLAGISDAIYGIIATFLEVKVEILSTNGGAYNAWTIMRNLANVFLVIAFIIIIYSQLTGVGVSNYGIKKTLPRLIIVAILMNVSFLICQLAVDLSNILGASLKGFLSELPVFKAGTGNWAADSLNSGNFFSNIAVGFLGGQVAGGVILGIAATGYFFGLGIFIPIIIAVIVAVLITFFILLARQMLIVVLIITAPIAFAAMLLPNTEKWAKWWTKVFIALLLIYPAIAILFGGSQLAANILIQVNPADIGWQLAAAAIAIVPLFLVPAMLKGSLNAVPAIGNLAQKLQSKGVGAAAKGTSKGMKTLGEYSAAKGGKFGGISKALHGGGMRGRLRQASAKRSYEEPRMKDLMAQWTNSENGETSIAQDENALFEIAKSDPSSFKGQAAISLLASQGNAVKLAELREKMDSPAKMASYSKAIASNYGALKAKDPRAVQDMFVGRGPDGEMKDAWAGLKQSDMHSMKDDSLKAGISASPTFRASLESAMQDPEQARHFTDSMYKKLGISRPSSASGSLSQVSAATIPPAPTQSEGGNPGGAPSSSPAPQVTPITAPAPVTPKLDPYDARTAQRQQEIQATIAAAPEMSQEMHIFHDEQTRRAAAAAPGTPASDATTSIDSHGVSSVVGQREDADRLFK